MDSQNLPGCHSFSLGAASHFLQGCPVLAFDPSLRSLEPALALQFGEHSGGRRTARAQLPVAA